MSTERKDIRLQIVISASELRRLDEWRAKEQVWSRSEAIRRLVAEALNAREKPKV